MEIIRSRKSLNYAKPQEKRKIEFIILHYTEMTFDAAMAKLCDPAAEVSAHYLIHKNGDIYCLVDDENIAWHAGKSSWKSIEKLNLHSIGIEIDNSGNEIFTDAQMQSCVELCHDLREKYKIERNCIIGHSDIAPNRKWDPGIFFNWRLLQENEIGIEHEIHFDGESYDVIFSNSDSGDGVTMLQEKLRGIGYNIQVSGIFDEQTNWAVRAFQSHFAQKAIWHRGGEVYFKDSKSLFPWDKYSEMVLGSICKG